jgi:hypothetical protein
MKFKIGFDSRDKKKYLIIGTKFLRQINGQRVNLLNYLKINIQSIIIFRV